MTGARARGLRQVVEHERSCHGGQALLSRPVVADSYPVAGPTVTAYLTYEEVFGVRPTRDQLEDWLRPLALDDCLQAVGKLSAGVSAKYLSSTQVDGWIAEALEDGRVAALRGIAQGRRLVFQSRLSILARVALDVSDRRPADAMRGGADIPRFARALLAVTDVFDLPGRFASPVRAEVEDAVSRMMLRRLAAQENAPLGPQFIRYWRLFVDLPERRPDLYEQGENFDRRMQAELGMSVRRYIVICFGLCVRFLTWRPEIGGEWAITENYWSSTTVTPDEHDRITNELSATPDAFNAAFHRQEREGFGEIDDLRPFALHPLCEIEPGRVMPIDVDSLGIRLFGDGLYWRLRPPATAPETEQVAYGASVGRMLEEHLFEVAASVYPAPTMGAKRLFREPVYGGEKGPDLAIVEGGRSVLIEVGADRVDTLNTIFRGDLNRYEDDIADVVIKRARQLDKKIDDARAGLLRLGDYRPSDPGVIHPVVCLLDGFPIAPTLRERVDAAVSDANLLRQGNLGRLEIISADELEALFGEVEHAGASVGQLLSDYATDVELRRWDLQDYLITRRGGMARTTFLEQEAKGLYDVLRDELFGSA